MARRKPEVAPEVVAEETPDQRVRLNALLARCGFGARRKCEEYITEGRVSVDGQVVTELATAVDLRKQKVLVDGEPLRPQRTVVFMVNKPKGMLCTHADPQGRPRVIDLFTKQQGRLFPIGRLDENSVGLILVTNDGELGHRLAHPRFRVAKIYHVHVAGTPTAEVLNELKKGIYFADGKFSVDGVRKLKVRGKSTVLEVVLREGQNREIRRLMARVGHKVMRLERVGFGPLRLTGVAPGGYRPLTRDEFNSLREYTAKFRDRVQEDQEERRAAREAAAKRPRPERPQVIPESIEVSPVARRVGSRDLTGLRRDGSGMTSETPFLSRMELQRQKEVRVARIRSPLLNSIEAAEEREQSGQQRPRRKQASGPRKPAFGKKAAGGSGRRSSGGSTGRKSAHSGPPSGSKAGGRSGRPNTGKRSGGGAGRPRKHK